MNISTKIKKIRVLKNYTQKYLAKSLDISQGYYNKIENGQAKITVEQLFMIAKILEIDLAGLLNFNEDEFCNLISVKPISLKDEAFSQVEQINELKVKLDYLEKQINLIRNQNQRGLHA